MYHFIAENIAEPLVLSEREQIPGTTCQYLKSFQIRAIHFIHAHYGRRQACILNDETGLGKCATVSAFLGAIAKKQKCLIVVQNDEELVLGWQFHLSLFSNLSVEVITGDADYTSSDHNIYIVKWTTLKDFEDLGKMNFDFITIDNRGRMLSNNFCLGVLLKNYEKKVNLVISSIDVTSDLNLLHKVLRLCGLLNHQYLSWRAFEEKFNLPNLNDVSTNKSDLEDYFLKREMLRDFCKDFRLRRYRHQFPGSLPLVDKNRYKNNLIAWKRNKHTILRSSSSQEKIFGSSEEKNTEELFEQYIQSRKETGLSDDVVNIIATKSVDAKEELLEESIITSPPLFCAEPKTEGDAKCNGQGIQLASLKQNANKTETVVLANKDNNKEDMSHLGTNLRIELIPISTEKSGSELICSSPNTIEVRTLRSRSIKLTKNSETCRKTRNAKKAIKSTQNKNKSTEGNLEMNECQINVDKTSTMVSNQLFVQNSKTSPKINERKLKTVTYISTSESESSSLEKDFPNKYTEPETTKETIDNCRETCEITNRLSWKTELSLAYKPPFKMNPFHKILNTPPTNSPIKQQNMNKSINFRKNFNFPINVNTIKAKEVPTSGLSGHAIYPSEMHTKETHSLLTTTRSCSNIQNKDMNIDFALNTLKKTVLPTKKTGETFQELKDTQEIASLLEQKVCENNPATSVVQLANNNANFTSSAPRLSNEESDYLPSSEYEEIQCGQKLTPLSSASSEYTQSIFKKSYAFLVPPTPFIRSSEQWAFCHIADSDLSIVHPPNAISDIIVLSSSQDENLISTQSSVSRRTRVLKRKGRVKPTNSNNCNFNSYIDSTPAFRELLAKQKLRSVTKSPDLFSNYSDTDMTCSQFNNISTFQGFKIFGSEVKEIQHASSPTNNCGARSCLDILENMLQPREKNANIAATEEMQSDEKTKATSPIHLYNEGTTKNTFEQLIKPACVDEDLIFEITKNCTFGSMIRVTHNGDVSPVQQQKSSLEAKHNRITNYLIGPPQSKVTRFETQKFPKTPSRSQLLVSNTPAISNSGTMISKKSPKSKSNTQTTKLTKWFGKHNTPTQKQVRESLRISLIHENHLD